MNRYSRNRIYVSKEEQEIIKVSRVLFAGAGIGSVIAECALRFGFENLIIIDFDQIEQSNLNRQNYTERDLGKYKVEALSERLLSINPDANVSIHNCHVNEGNVEELLSNCDIAVNALDFNSGIPFVFDDIAKKNDIPVLHPYNFGWAGFVAVVMPDGMQLSDISNKRENFEKEVANYVYKYNCFWNVPNDWLGRVIEEYQDEDPAMPPPQLSIGSWIVAGLSTNILYNIATGKAIKVFPKFYMSSILDEDY